MFSWNSKKPEQKVFESFKKTFTTAPILAYFNLNLKTWVKSNTSDYMEAAILL